MTNLLNQLLTSNRKAFWRGFAAVMLWGALMLAAFLFAGCATRVYSPSGKIALAVYSDINGHMRYKTRELEWEFTGTMDNSKPTRVGMDGVAKNLISAGVGGATAIVP